MAVAPLIAATAASAAACCSKNLAVGNVFAVALGAVVDEEAAGPADGEEAAGPVVGDGDLGCIRRRRLPCLSAVSSSPSLVGVAEADLEARERARFSVLEFMLDAGRHPG